MVRASFHHKLMLLCLTLSVMAGLISCDSLFVDDGDDAQGVSLHGGYYYFVDNEANSIRMMDGSLRVLKSWSLESLSGDTRLQGITYDGENLWVSVAGSFDMLYQLDASGDSLVVLKSFDAPPSGRGTIRDISWDGTFLWAVNSGSVTYEISPTLYKLDPDDGSILAEYPLPHAEPRALVAVGENSNAYGSGAPVGLYISDVDQDSIYKFRTDKVMFEGAFASPTPPRGESYIFPVALAFDGECFWLINSSSAGDHLYRLSYDGVEEQRIELPYVTPGALVWTTGDVRVAGPPTITGVSPNTGTRGLLTTVVVTGSGFRPGDGLTVSFGAGITTTDILFVDGGRLEVEIQIANDAAFGSRDVVVTNPDGQQTTGVGYFTIPAIDPLAGYLWLADPNADSLYKIRIIDTTIVQSWSTLGVAPGGSAQGLTYDGTHIWLSAGGSDDRIIKLNTDGATLSAISSITAPPDAAGLIREIAFDGQYIWAANSGTDYIYQLDTTTGDIQDSIPTPTDEVRGIVYVNGELYCNDRGTDSVYVYNFTSSAWSPVFPTPIPPGGDEGNRWSTGMCWDGVNFWLVNSTYEFDYIFQVSTDGAVLRTYEVPNRGDAQPSALTYTQD